MDGGRVHQANWYLGFTSLTGQEQERIWKWERTILYVIIRVLIQTAGTN